MATTARRIVTGGSVDDAVKALDLDPARDCGSREAFEAWMQEKADTILASFDGVHFDIAEPIRTIACKVAPINDGGAWYTPPSEDFSRPGTMWFSFTDDQELYSKWRETTTVFHEGVPGHHLQCAQVVHRAELLNRWQRLLCWVSGHGEGWALYSERLMDELGYFDDPGDRLGFLDMQGFRAARVIVDIGVHLGLTIPADNPYGWRPGEVWDGEKVFEFMRGALADGGRPARVRGQPLPRLAGPGAVVQGRRADLAAGARRGQGAQGRGVRPQGVPHRGAQPRLDRARPAEGSARPAVSA